MNARVAFVHDGLSFRQVITLGVFRWNLLLGFTVAPRDLDKLKERRRRRLLLDLVPDHLHDDVGLRRQKPPSTLDQAIWFYLAR